MAEDTEHPLPAPSDDDPGEQLPLVELEMLANQPPSQRRRVVQIGMGLAALVVVFVTFWGVIRPKAPPVAAPHAQPTESPPTLLITSNVNYGTITIKGQKQRGAPPLEVTMSTQPPIRSRLTRRPSNPLPARFQGGVVKVASALIQTIARYDLQTWRSPLPVCPKTSRAR